MRRQRRVQASHRLNHLQALLSSGPLTLDEVAERMGAHRRSVQRWIEALREIGIRVEEEADGHRKRFWIARAGRGPIPLGQGRLISLEVAASLVKALAGTGFAESLDEIRTELGDRADSAVIELRVRFRERWLDMSEAPFDYHGREDDCDALVSALIRDQGVAACHVAIGRGSKEFRIDPYGLIYYRKGLYVVGLSHHHKALRTFGLDGLSQIRWLKKQRFERPADFDLQTFAGRAFGLIIGARTSVRLRFDPSVARYVKRRRWHPSQQFVTSALGLEMALQVDGTTELLSWVLSFGSKVEVLEPETLRIEVRRESQAMLASST